MSATFQLGLVPIKHLLTFGGLEEGRGQDLLPSFFESSAAAAFPL